MSDLIGTITVPSLLSSGTFPLQLEYGVVSIVQPEFVIHTFGAGNAKREQRFYLGNGARKWQISQEVDEEQRLDVFAFWEARKGGHQPFTFNAPNEDGSSTLYTVHFANEPISIDYGFPMSRLVCQLVEVNTGAGPSYPLNADVLRFPSEALAAALSGQTQTLIPLVRIKPKQADYPYIHLSDRRCTVGGQLYQARLLRWENIEQVAVGVPNETAETDNAKFVFGNADRVMRDLAYSVSLAFADVEFSIYHVDSGIRLLFWKGEVTPDGWEFDPSSVEFSLSCSDPISSPFMVLPNRTIVRKCSKLYKAGYECPWNSGIGLDLVHFPSASADSCDRGYDTPNGCLAHHMEGSFNGVIATPQQVRVKDNSTGTFGIARSMITPTSQIAESQYGQPLPIVVTDIDFKMPGRIIAGRDEGEFYQALAIVCQGPVIFGTGHTLDGQYHHGYPGPDGLRILQGSDPAGPQDWMSLDQSGDQRGGDFRKVFSGGSTYLYNYSAGVAALVIRRADEKGIQLTTLDQHSVEAIISRGWQAWRWTGAGSKSSGSMTNPVWLAVNAYLLGRGLWFDATETQEENVDIGAALTWGPVCDTTVSRLVGSGTETQFKAIGTIRDQRQLRDCLTDILVNALGYYTFSFGRLRIGMRENAGAVSAYTQGNILYQSLRVRPASPQFTQLTATFADREHNWVANTAVYQDDDLALELGEGVRVVHRPGNMALPLTADISQAQRIVTIRGREESGGITAAERRACVNVSFSTTVIGLDTDPGAVVSITDPDMPNGFGKIRVSRYKLRSDWGIDIKGRTVTDSMYNLVTGPKPADVRPGAIPPEVFPLPLAPVWHPNEEVAIAGDPFFNSGDRNFSLSQVYLPGRDGVTQVALSIGGKFPINSTLEDVVPAQIRSSSVSSSGGYFGVGNYWFAVAVMDADGRFGPSSNIIAKHFSSGTSNRVTLSDIEWPAGSFAGYVIFGAAADGRMLCEQLEVSGSLPTSISINFPLSRSTYGLPSPLPKKIRVKGKEVIHSGADGAYITHVSTGKFRCAELATLADDWTYRVVSVITDESDGSAPLWNFKVLGYDYTTAEFTCTPDPQAAGVEAGDVVIIRYAASTASETEIGDYKFVTGRYPTGMEVNGERGNTVRIISGRARGQARLITANTSTVLTVDDPFDPAPELGDAFIVEASGWTSINDGTELTAATKDTPVKVDLPVGNFQNKVMGVIAVLVDKFGNESPEPLSPFREIWVFGQLSNVIQSQVRITADYVASPKDRNIYINATDNSVTVTMAHSSLTRGLPTVFLRDPGGPGNTVTILPATGISGLEDDTINNGNTSKTLVENESIMVLFY